MASRFLRAFRLAGLSCALAWMGAAPVLGQQRSAPQTPAGQSLLLAEELYEEALTLRQQGTREQSDSTLRRAEREFRNVLNLDPANIGAAVRLSTILYVTNRSRDAIPLLQASLRRTPNEGRLKHQLGLNLFAVNREQEGRPLLEEATRADPDLYDAHVVLARYYYSVVHDNDAAVSSYQAYLRARPASLSEGDALVYGSIGNAHLAAQRYPQARAQYQKVLELNERNIPARINIAYSYYMEGNYTAAVTRYEALLRLGDPSPVVLANLARSLFKLGRTRQGVLRAQQLQKVRPRSHQGFLVEAEILLATGNARGAIPKLRLALERAPRDIPTLIAAASGFDAAGDLTSAQQHLDTARRIEPRNLDVVATLAKLLRRRGREREALPLYERVTVGRPRDAEAWFGVGACRYAMGENDAAIAAFETTLRRSARHAQAKCGLAATHNRMGVDLLGRNDAAGAQAAFERAIAADGASVAAHRNLGELLLRQGNAEGALVHLQQGGRDDPDAAFLFGRALLELGRGADAVAKLRVAASGHGRVPAQEVGLALGVALSINGEHDEAITTLRSALGASPSPEQARLLSIVVWRRSLSHISAGRDRQALADLDAADQGRRALSEGERRRLDFTQAIALMASSEGRQALQKLQRLGRVDATYLASPYDSVGMDYFVMYAKYLSNDYRGFFRALGTVRARASGDLPQSLARLEINARVRNAEALFSRGSVTQAASEISAIRRLGAVGATDDIVRLADACLQYARGRRAEAGAVFGDLARRVRAGGNSDVPREALLNLGIFRDQVQHDNPGAVQAYGQYIASRGRHSDVARRLLERKERVLGLTAQANAQ